MMRENVLETTQHFFYYSNGLINFVNTFEPLGLAVLKYFFRLNYSVSASPAMVKSEHAEEFLKSNTKDL